MAPGGIQLPKKQSRPLALPPKGGSKAPSPVASGSATPAAGSPAASGSGQINGVAEAIRHYADEGVQSLIKEGATSPAPSAAQADSSRGASGTLPTLQNLVATVDLNTRLDLKTIALHARNAEYNPKRFAAVIMRIREPKSTALVFASGKMVVTGTKSEDEAKLAARKFARIIHKLGFEDAKFNEFKIQNVVASCDVKFPVRLEGLAVKHGLFSSYEPELFPGLIYRMVKPKVVLLIFVSGKVVLTGAKTREDINVAWSQIYPVLADFRKQQ